MSEYLKNKEYKQQILKKLIMDLHNGKDFEEVKREFGKLVAGVDATEIADMEQQLIKEGMPEQEIKRLCDVHAAIFRDALTTNEESLLTPGHPAYTLKHENDEAKKVLDELDNVIKNFENKKTDERLNVLGRIKEKLSFFRSNLDKHFSKKENIFFPYLERHDITGPPAVMWSVDDEIRDMLKELTKIIDKLETEGGEEFLQDVKNNFLKTKDKILEMFFKEENILVPMMKDKLYEAEWVEIKEQEESEFGIIFSKPEIDLWRPQNVIKRSSGVIKDDGDIELDTGSLTPKEINIILKNLPVDITFVDSNDRVRYFSHGKERIFTRTKSIIGRKVANCHPPESVHVVEKIVNDFKSGKHNSAEFWLELNDSFIHIRYIALRDDSGEYIGTMEVSQDVTKIRALEGERRLLQYND